MIDLSNVPEKVAIRNTSSKDIKIGISGYNQSFNLPVGEAVKLKVDTSSELIGVLSQEVEGVVSVVDASTTMSVGVTKISNDIAVAIMGANKTNQNLVTLERIGNTIICKGDLAKLGAWASSVPVQGTHKWLAVDVDTGESSILDVAYNGSDLTTGDVEEATTWGLSSGHFILWLKCDEIAVTPKEITLSVEGKTSEKITFIFE